MRVTSLTYYTYIEVTATHELGDSLTIHKTATRQEAHHNEAHLPDRALGLLALLLLQLPDIDVLPQIDGTQAARYQANTSD
jgi:hypothetical protein